MVREAGNVFPDFFQWYGPAEVISLGYVASGFLQEVEQVSGFYSLKAHLYNKIYIFIL